MEEVFKLKETKDIQRLTAMHDPLLDSGQGEGRGDSYEGQVWHNWQNLKMDCGLDHSIVSILHFLILIIVFWVCKRMPVCLGNTQWSI